MCHKVLLDARFYGLLFKFDTDIAAAVRASGCKCGGVLHSARYPRQPRGGPEDLGPDYEKRLSFCCDECRHRTTPPSMRFLGRKVYLGAVVMLTTAMRHGLKPPRVARLKELFGVGVKTLARWRSWWREAFAESRFWQGARGHFVPAVKKALLPLSLLERMRGAHEQERLVNALRFVSPITTTSCALVAGI